jgi:hypothetical protein
MKIVKITLSSDPFPIEYLEKIWSVVQTRVLKLVINPTKIKSVQSYIKHISHEYFLE